jgi:glycosyltransferase involved in cell wall biosynthesis
VAERISVIVATYNRPAALDAVLRSLVCQNDADFEVLVADDGSTQPTKELIDAWQTVQRPPAPCLASR